MSAAVATRTEESVNTQLVNPDQRITPESHSDVSRTRAIPAGEDVMTGFKSYALDDDPDDLDSFMENQELFSLQLILRMLEGPILHPEIPKGEWDELLRVITEDFEATLEQGIARRPHVLVSEEKMNSRSINFDISSAQGEFEILRMLRSVSVDPPPEPEVAQIIKTLKTRILATSPPRKTFGGEETVALLRNIYNEFISHGDEVEGEILRHSLLLWFVSLRAHLTGSLDSRAVQQQIEALEQDFNAAARKARKRFDQPRPKSASWDSLRNPDFNIDVSWETLEGVTDVLEDYTEYALKNVGDDKNTFGEIQRAVSLQLMLRSLEAKAAHPDISGEHWDEMVEGVTKLFDDISDLGLVFRKSSVATGKKESVRNLDINSREGELATLRTLTYKQSDEETDKLAEALREASSDDSLGSIATVTLIRTIVNEFITNVIESSEFSPEEYHREVDRYFTLLRFVVLRAEVTDAIVTEHSASRIRELFKEFRAAMKHGSHVQEQRKLHGQAYAIGLKFRKPKPLVDESLADRWRRIANDFIDYVNAGIEEGSLPLFEEEQQAARKSLSENANDNNWKFGSHRRFLAAYEKGREFLIHKEQCAHAVTAGRELLNHQILPLKKAAIASSETVAAEQFAGQVRAVVEEIVKSFTDRQGVECKKEKSTFARVESENALEFINGVNIFHSQVARIGTGDPKALEALVPANDILAAEYQAFIRKLTQKVSGEPPKRGGSYSGHVKAALTDVANAATEIGRKVVKKLKTTRTN